MANRKNIINQLKRTVVEDITEILKNHNRMILNIADIDATEAPIVIENYDTDYTYTLDRIQITEGGLELDASSAFDNITLTDEGVSIEVLDDIQIFLEEHEEELAELYDKPQLSEETEDAINGYVEDTLKEFFDDYAPEMTMAIIDDVISDILETADWNGYEDGEFNPDDVRMAIRRVIKNRVTE
jgi:hypothetical protein